MLRLGIIGLSPGNGHPYSWSAIFNGYDRETMESCGFPVIPRYLEQREFPADQISGARVTRVWAQERTLAEHVARASNIDAVVDHYTDMIGQVDAVLLARDDAERHCEFALPFLEAGVPVYVDKPLALSLADARLMLDAQRYPGQLFSCSALRYACEFKLSDKDHAAVGTIRQIHATTPKDWNKYAVHVIEPALLLVDGRGGISDVRAWRGDDTTTLGVRYESGFQLLVSAMGGASAPLALRVMGDRGWRDLVFQDSFTAFRSALQEFVDGVRARQQRISPDFVLEVVRLIEAGIHE
jgi:predicted dehydrogenase